MKTFQFEHIKIIKEEDIHYISFDGRKDTTKIIVFGEDGKLRPIEIKTIILFVYSVVERI